MRVYAIGDVHGCLDLLDTLLDHVDADLVARPCRHPLLVFLGDYVDRGSQSFSVIERLIEIKGAYRVICLRGNHDLLFQNFLEDPTSLTSWAALGGISTLMSYGLHPPLQPRPQDGAMFAALLGDVMPESHRKFLSTLPLTYTCGDYVFVHAGLRPNVPLQKQTIDDLLWIRDDFLLYDGRHNKIVVHGHSPVMEPDIRPNRINIDTGAFATGRLTCLVLEGPERRFLRTGPTPSTNDDP